MKPETYQMITAGVGALVAGFLFARRGWTQIRPLIPKLEAFLTDWAGAPNGARGVMERLVDVEHDTKLLRDSVTSIDLKVDNLTKRVEGC